jgi:Mg2+ and Co2+ transporter CorA
MKPNSDSHQITNIKVGVYECEIHLKFRIIEEKSILSDRDQLLQVLLEALTEGSDEFLETLHASVKAQEDSEFKASPQMRRKLMRIRSSVNDFEQEVSPQTPSEKTDGIYLKISEERLQKLQETATLLGIPIEELMQMRVEEVLNKPEASFKGAMDYVLNKNTELYNRLA